MKRNRDRFCQNGYAAFGFINKTFLFLINVFENVMMPENLITQPKHPWNSEGNPL